ncbi:hypothetical protein BDV12DRAFT_23856 [Aspergillus spectabilis]
MICIFGILPARHMSPNIKQSTPDDCDLEAPNWFSPTEAPSRDSSRPRAGVKKPSNGARSRHSGLRRLKSKLFGTGGNYGDRQASLLLHTLVTYPKGPGIQSIVPGLTEATGHRALVTSLGSRQAIIISSDVATRTDNACALFTALRMRRSGVVHFIAIVRSTA